VVELQGATAAVIAAPFALASELGNEFAALFDANCHRRNYTTAFAADVVTRDAARLATGVGFGRRGGLLRRSTVCGVGFRALTVGPTPHTLFRGQT